MYEFLDFRHTYNFVHYEPPVVCDLWRLVKDVHRNIKSL